MERRPSQRIIGPQDPKLDFSHVESGLCRHVFVTSPEGTRRSRKFSGHLRTLSKAQGRRK